MATPLSGASSASTSGPSTPTYYGDESLKRNGADLPYVIQKYGGTSVGKSLDSITEIVEYVLLLPLCL